MPETQALHADRLWLTLLLCWLLCWLLQVGTAAAQDHTTADPRQLFKQADSPHWLRAVGKLQVPGIKFEGGYRSHYREDCSATLVGNGGASADTIVTAWHCVEYYRDLSHRIQFTLLPGSDASFSIEARPLADGGSMRADWAILRLQRPVPMTLVSPLSVTPQRADAQRPVTMAGFSRDIGNGGQQLSYDPVCRITHQDTASSDSDCAAHKGASGGAVVQLDDDGMASLSGVISRGDGERYSIYVPTTSFIGTLRSYLN